MEILYQYWPLNRPINLLNVDVEGHEIEVFLSNNWEKYVPEWIIIEVFHTSIESLPQCRIGELDYSSPPFQERIVRFSPQYAQVLHYPLLWAQ